MNKSIFWIKNNCKWVFSGIGTLVISGIFSVIFLLFFSGGNNLTASGNSRNAINLTRPIVINQPKKTVPQNVEAPIQDDVNKEKSIKLIPPYKKDIIILNTVSKKFAHYNDTEKGMREIPAFAQIPEK